MSDDDFDDGAELRRELIARGALIPEAEHVEVPDSRPCLTLDAKGRAEAGRWRPVPRRCLPIDDDLGLEGGARR